MNCILNIFVIFKQIIFQILYIIFFYINKNKSRTILIIFTDCSNSYSNLLCLELELIRKNIPYKKTFNNKNLKNLFIISRSSIIFIDQSNYFLSYIKLYSFTQVIQCWHGGGLYKKVGFDNCENRNWSKIKRIYRNINFLNISDDKLKQFYSNMFHIDLSYILSFGLPRTDLLFQKNIMLEKRKFYNLYPELENKKICLYAPTFREKKGIREQPKLMDIESVNKNIAKRGYVLIFRSHPTLKYQHDNVVNVSHLDLDFILTVSDILITDYSSILFDFSYFKRPIILYIPDLKEYQEYDRRLYLKPSSLVGEKNICYYEQDIIKVIEKASYDVDIWSLYMDNCKGSSSKALINFALRLNEGKI